MVTYQWNNKKMCVDRLLSGNNVFFMNMHKLSNITTIEASLLHNQIYLSSRKVKTRKEKTSQERRNVAKTRLRMINKSNIVDIRIMMHVYESNYSTFSWPNRKFLTFWKGFHWDSCVFPWKHNKLFFFYCVCAWWRNTKSHTIVFISVSLHASMYAYIPFIGCIVSLFQVACISNLAKSPPKLFYQRWQNVETYIQYELHFVL